ncbi:MAG TPA: AraC family transcriptional regulator [Cyclobacteriaceae bacterium]|nr:AraC family transcriptional regulator [Cyclobacteriaceae bacterium]
MMHTTIMARPRRGSAKDIEYIAEFHSWILSHLDMPHSLTSLAEQAGFSISKMQRLFREVYDVSVIAFIRHEKLVRAKGQIEVTNMNIKSIASEAGYRSLPAFTAAFSIAFNVTPALLRRQIRK